MNSMKKLLGILLCCAISWNLNAEPSDKYIFRMLDTNSGLPDNNVRNMMMLPNGMMCIQTSSMLNIYDGALCRSYKYNAIKIPYTEYSGMNEAHYDSTENIIWCSTRDNIWIFNLATKQFEYDVTGRLSQKNITTSSAKSIYIDDSGRFWVITEDGKIWVSDRGSTKTASIPQGMDLPLKICQHKDISWIMSKNGKLAEFDPSTCEFRSIRAIPTQSPAHLSSRMEIDITQNGKIWMMYDKDLITFNQHKNEFVNFCNIPSDSKDLYTTIALDSNDNLWLGTARSGVTVLDGTNGKTNNLPFLSLTDGKKVYHHTDISKIYIDADNGVWIATLSEGLLYWHRDIIRFDTINSQTISMGYMNDESVKCMIEADNGNIYIGTIHGLLLYNPKTRKITIPYAELKDELCISLYKDTKERIWLGTFYNGAYCIHNGGITHFKYKDIPVDVSYHEASPNYNCVRSFKEDSKGRFWISVYGGAGLFDPSTGYISLLREEFPELERFMVVRDICETPDGNIIFSGDNGQFKYCPDQKKIISDLSNENSHTQTNQVLVDNRQLLWQATADGIRVTNLRNGEEYHISSSNGLPAGNIMSITLDDVGNVWAAAFSQIARVRLSEETDGRFNFIISTYKAEDGIESGAFFQKSILKHSDGHIYIGGAHGICDINPEDLYQMNYTKAPIINGIIIGESRLDHWNKSLILNHDQSFLTFEFSNLNYANPSHTTYQYMLEGMDNTWRITGGKGPGIAQYTNLNPGKYRLLIRAANNDNDWSATTTFLIVIRPPWYKSLLAYIIYICSLILLFAFFVFSMTKRTKRKIQENKEKEMQRQREKLDQMKFKFFTNVSHELRTPLSLIILPLESAMAELKDSPVMPKLQTMHHNANQLLFLVNHLLDFRRLEMGGERLNLTSGDISDFVKVSVASFKDAAARSNITLSIEDELEKPMMVFDNVQMQKILNNLLSNALKFTNEGGLINIRISQIEPKTLKIEVSDTGIGIPEKELKNIFDRFYRSSNTELRTGSGIGLSIVKQYIDMHSGQIEVKSEVGKGTTFTVLIPMDLKATLHEEDTEKETLAKNSDNETTTAENRRHILVVDDNADFRDYLVGELSDLYDVNSASDGKECLNILQTVNPEIVVCDVMMPNLDGFEVVKRIKNNIETSHIPVILLSARTSEDVRLEGYETGADAYLTKPFKLDILKARIKNLMEQTDRRKASFSKGIDISPSEVAVTTIDQKLMDKIMQYIEKNMDNADYSVEELSSDIGMHRMNLYRKIQSIAGMTPTEFIRTMRLKRAAQLLRDDPNLTIAEVCDKVGFNTQKYFTKYFKEMFGVPPSQYRS